MRERGTRSKETIEHVAGKGGKKEAEKGDVRRNEERGALLASSSKGTDEPSYEQP